MPGPKIDKSYIQDLQRAKQLVRDLLKVDLIHGGVIRLCIHDAFAFDAEKQVFGANASIRTQKELSHDGNEGLSEIVAVLASIKAAVPNISFADLYQLAGIEAIASAGGPQIPFTAGRKDGWSFPPQSAYLSPNTGERPLEQFKDWVSRTGLGTESAIALLGVHTIARWWPDTGDEVLGESSTAFSNAYFQKVLANDIPQDAWLLADTDYRKQIDLFAKEETAFREAYAKAHEKLSLLGSNLSSNPIELKIADSSPEYAVTATEYAIYAAGVFVATSAAAYGIWRWRQRYLRSGKLLW